MYYGKKTYDSVTKNLKIEQNIAGMLGSSHIPYHLLCKSHSVEALNQSNLAVLSKIEKVVKQRQINSFLKPFFRGKSTVVEAGIEFLLNLITYDKSA